MIGCPQVQQMNCSHEGDWTDFSLQQRREFCWRPACAPTCTRETNSGQYHLMQNMLYMQRVKTLTIRTLHILTHSCSVCRYIDILYAWLNSSVIGYNIQRTSPYWINDYIKAKQIYVYVDIYHSGWVITYIWNTHENAYNIWNE